MEVPARNDSVDGAIFALETAMKGNANEPLHDLRQRIEEIRADYPSDVFPGDVGKGARMAIDRVLALFAIYTAKGSTMTTAPDPPTPPTPLPEGLPDPGPGGPGVPGDERPRGAAR